MNANYYIAKVYVRNCVVDLRVNDIPLVRQTVGGDMFFERPVNYLIERSGEQILTIDMLPYSSTGLSLNEYLVNVEIWRYDATGQRLKEIEKILTVSIDSQKDPVIPKTKRVFIADVGYRISRWSSCEIIRAGSNIKPLVVSFLSELTQVLSKKQYDIYAQMIDKREHDICKSLYLGEEEVKKRMGMLKDCLDNGFEYLPLKGPQKMVYYSNRRVVSVVDEDMKSSLKFYNSDTGEILTLDMLLGIPKGSNSLKII